MSKAAKIERMVEVDLSDIRLKPGEYMQVHFMHKTANATVECMGTMELRIKLDGTIEVFKDNGVPDSRSFDAWYPGTER